MDGASGERDIDLVLVTGAGASHEFGVNHTKMPLMGAWSDALIEKISSHSWAYVEATGLEKGLAGQEFEQRLGRFLQMAQALPSIEQVLKPSLQFQGLNWSLNDQSMAEWHRTTVFHVNQITNLIHESLYEAFSYEKMDLNAATTAYSALLGQLGVSDTHSLVYATTNYDVVGEYVIHELGGLADWGERHGLLNQGEQPLQVDGLLRGMPRYVPVLHLHGRMGWYMRDGNRAVSSNTTRHNDGFGVPIVMLPDPDKDYTANPVISSLWSQFEESLSRARRVFVLGHSLHDPALLGALRRNVNPPERLAVSVLGVPGTPGEIAEDTGDISTILAQELPNASIVPTCFSMHEVEINQAVDAWNERLSRAVGQQSA